jgi:hypothetical protein
MEQKIKILNEMQNLDDKIGKKLILTTQLPTQLKTMKNNVKETQEKVNKTKKALEDNLKDQKNKEMDIQSNLEKIAKYKNQLLAIKSNKEYKALNSEVTHLEKKNSEIDDLRVELMEEEDNLREQLKEETLLFKKAEDELKANQNRIEIQIEEVHLDIENLKEQRNKLTQDLPKEITKRYALLIKHKDRKAVAFNEKGTCSACGFKLRSQLIIEINKGDTVENCENCGRMLIYKMIE